MKFFKCEASIVFPQVFPHQASCNQFYSRRSLRVSNCSDENFSELNVKRAKLTARKQDRVKIPCYDLVGGRGEKIYPIREFLSHPSGIEALLNTRALQSFEQIDSTTYRCTLPQLNFLKFEVSPVIDLRVTPTNEDCMVELLSCKFEGSEVMKRQNEHFSAEMTNYITWCTNNSEPYLDVDVKLNLTLEIYTRPFSLLPTSAVEAPGTLMMQALVDRLVPLLLQQLIQDYGQWVTQNPEWSLVLPDA
ncbi:uncharacterized protein LOC112501549 [Cynara cardunculus var. scolymus]|uniref:uncharacterized protein LOC112501549 n=1 Tax=Cynara cardunculus var. scolymus TaxID=59895 RepID=UPI000D62F374|nr:uncharacterized protein LOC112501549 [Cynara cardunculus var. scolymus]XP_024960972.1 uncharacterized protein LOC112501549 [Cynara cardunculus var. scolymus]